MTTNTNITVNRKVIGLNHQKSTKQMQISLISAVSLPNLIAIDQTEAEKLFVEHLQQRKFLNEISNSHVPFLLEQLKVGSAPTASEYKMDPALYGLKNGHKNSVQMSMDNFRSI